MKYIKILSVLLLFVAIPNIHGMEVDINQEKPVELMDLPNELVLAIIHQLFEVGTLKDIRNLLWTNNRHANLLVNEERKALSKEIYDAFISKHSNTPSFQANDVLLIKKLQPKLVRLLGQDDIDITFPLLTNADLENLLSHIISVDAKKLDSTKIRATLMILKSLAFQVGKRKLNLNKENKNGLTLLMWTTTLPDYWLNNGHTEALQDTIAQFEEIDINYKNKNGKSFKDMARAENLQYVETRINIYKKLREKLEKF